jgi:hypothetical protein
MIPHRFVVTALALFLGFSISGSPKAHGVSPGPTPASFGQDRGDWDAPPKEFSEIQRKGFRDGIDGARRDIENHRNPDPNNRDEFRHPDVPREMWDAYREGFRRGYDVGVRRVMGGAPMQQGPWPEQVAPSPERGGPGMLEGPGREVMLHGFQDGMVGALRDVENRRQLDPNNRDEFRSPDVPPEMREAYRDGFRHGYEQGAGLLTNGPERDDDFRRHAFEDGVAGALNDFSNDRRPDPNNRDEFRSPRVPYNMQDAYRDSFRHGYERAMSEVMGYSGHR